MTAFFPALLPASRITTLPFLMLNDGQNTLNCVFNNARVHPRDFPVRVSLGNTGAVWEWKTYIFPMVALIIEKS